MEQLELIAYLREIGRVTLALASLAAVFVIWAMVRYRRAGPPVPGAPVTLAGGAYRGGTARPLFGSRLPWVVYAALLASLMGAAFVLLACGYELWATGRLGSGLPEGLVHKAGVIGCSLARLALFGAALATLRRKPTAARRARIAGALTLVCSVVYAHWVVRESAVADWDVVGLVDGGLYVGGLLLTWLLVARAGRAMQRVAGPAA